MAILRWQGRYEAFRSQEHGRDKPKPRSHRLNGAMLGERPRTFEIGESEHTAAYNQLSVTPLEELGSEDGSFAE